MQYRHCSGPHSAQQSFQIPNIQGGPLRLAHHRALHFLWKLSSRILRTSAVVVAAAIDRVHDACVNNKSQGTAPRAPEPLYIRYGVVLQNTYLARVSATHLQPTGYLMLEIVICSETPTSYALSGSIHDDRCGFLVETWPKVLRY